MTIEQAKQDIKTLELSIKTLLLEFEKKYGEDMLNSISISRWNGSNNAFGWVSKVKVNTRII